MAKGKNVLTTGEVAKICNVAPRTVSKWFDTGQLKGYRIPGSKDRRIPVNELARFMKIHNMPTTSLPTGSLRVVIVDSDIEAAKILAEKLTQQADYEIRTADSNFETGTLVQKFSPHVLLINLLSNEIDVTQICESIRKNEDLQTIKIIAVANKLGPAESTALLQKGFDGYLPNTADVTAVIREIEKLTAIIY